MATSVVEAGGGSPRPAEAIVGSGLVALRSDLSEFMGWVVALQDGKQDTKPQGRPHHAVTICKVDADGEGSEVLQASASHHRCGAGCGDADGGCSAGARYRRAVFEFGAEFERGSRK